jgi:uncharacterized protein YqfA (UPF0365 family)
VVSCQTANAKPGNADHLSRPEAIIAARARMTSERAAAFDVMSRDILAVQIASNSNDVGVADGSFDNEWAF